VSEMQEADEVEGIHPGPPAGRPARAGRAGAHRVGAALQVREVGLSGVSAVSEMRERIGALRRPFCSPIESTLMVFSVSCGMVDMFLYESQKGACLDIQEKSSMNIPDCIVRCMATMD